MGGFDYTRYDSDRSELVDFEPYDAAFAPFVDREVKLLELGVHRGGSLKLWRDYFPRGTIVGLDCEPVALDDADRIHVYRGRQEDTALLTRIAGERAPDGFDLIIDDASHLGAATRTSFWHLFKHHLKPGGLFVIEDWGTGYWSDWPDGHAFVDGRPHLDGMVGFIKELVDELGSGDRTRGSSTGVSDRGTRFQSVRFVRHLVFVTKRDRAHVRAVGGFDHTRYDSDRSELVDFEPYDAAFAPFVDREVKLLELGVHRGGSLKLWRDYFPRGTIVGLDCEPVALDDADRIHVYRGRQEDTALLTRIAGERAPDGFDLIIDDASHLAAPTRTSFWHLFEHHLKPGGLFVLEDWGTGCWSDWPDGHAFVDGRPHLDGMVGFIKELVDEQGMGARTRGTIAGTPTRRTRFDRLLFVRHLVFVTKRQSRLTEPAQKA